MALIIQKYGGTSLATVERIKIVARHIASYYEQGHQLVVVVSAMGHETDRLKALAFEVCENPSLRELDVLLTAGERVSMSLLSIALGDLAHPCVSFTGSQSGILTDTTHGNARITNILGDRIQTALAENKIVIVGGFQGMAIPTKDITTLGRGGSDLTAVALSQRMKADLCEIYTDVEGIYNSDPRHFPAARLLTTINHRELCQLAWSGAGVVHTRAAQLAAKHNIAVRIRSSFNLEHQGTCVQSSPERRAPMENGIILAITHQRGLGLVTMTAQESNEIASLYSEMNELLWQKGLVPAMQSYVNDGKGIQIQMVFDQRMIPQLSEKAAEKFNIQSNSRAKLCCINIIGDGFFQDHGLVGNVLKELGSDILAFQKNNDLLKILLEDEKSDEITRRLQERFLTTEKI